MAKPGGPQPRQPLYIEIALAAMAESLNSRNPTSLVAVEEAGPEWFGQQAS